MGNKVESKGVPAIDWLGYADYKFQSGKRGWERVKNFFGLAEPGLGVMSFVRFIDQETDPDVVAERTSIKKLIYR